MVGLGTGTVAAYAKPGQSLTYFEIDAAVLKIATDPQYFTYLTNCKVEPEVCMGDARLTLARPEYDGKFDVLFIDAFSSDAIPVHLLTHEAVEMYCRKLAPHGLLIVHLSNGTCGWSRSLRAQPKSWDSTARVRTNNNESAIGKTTSTWAVLTQTPENLGPIKKNKMGIA